jgi:replicative DNA helicase
MPDIQNQQREVRTPRAASKQADLSAYMFGKVPPQARELEEAVLGAIMLEKAALTAVIEILSPQSFYMDAHGRIYAAILRLYEHSKAIDILTVTEELRKSGELEVVGGAFYIASLTNRVASTANLEFHARIVAQKHIQRELIRVSSGIIKDAFEETTDVFELLDSAERNLFSITHENLTRNYLPMHSLLAKAVQEIENIRKSEGELSGVGSGFPVLDRITNGWQRSDLVVIAARPGMGKTAFTLALARNAAIDCAKPVAIFSLEMSSLQLVKRLISSETELPADKIRRGDLQDHEWQQLNTLAGRLSDAPIFIDDTPAIDLFELRAKCRRLKSNHDIQLVIVDYLQLMRGSADNKQMNREQEISQISRSLKSLAKELDIPVVALSQLNRSVETRGGVKRPQLADLRESGAIEQDADMVVFLYRPEYYGITQDAQGNSLQGMCEVIIAKHRNGALANVWVQFIGKFAKFVPAAMEYTSSDEEAPPAGTVKRSSRANDITEDFDHGL